MIYQPEPPRRPNIPYWKKVLPVVVFFIVAVCIIGYRIHRKNERLRQLQAESRRQAEDFIRLKLPEILAVPEYQRVQMRVVSDETNELGETNPLCGIEVNATIPESVDMMELKQTVESGKPMKALFYFKFNFEILVNYR